MEKVPLEAKRPQFLLTGWLEFNPLSAAVGRHASFL
jgi:hypothetical protein